MPTDTSVFFLHTFSAPAGLKSMQALIKRLKVMNSRTLGMVYLAINPADFCGPYLLGSKFKTTALGTKRQVLIVGSKSLKE